MKPYRLLVEWGVVVQLRELPPRSQRAIYAVFKRLEETPDFVSEFQTRDAKGHLLDAFICADFAFHYWIDFGDRHVKVLAMEKADSRGS